MPTVDSNLIPEGRKKRKYKQKYIKTTDLNSVQSKGKARWLRIEEGRNNIIAMCPGTKFKRTNKPTQSLYCVDGKLIISDESFPNVKEPTMSKREVQPSDLSCIKSIKETIIATDEICGPHLGNGKLNHIGWTWEKDNVSSFTAQITVCHDSQNENTYFTNHTLYGLSVQARDTRKSRQVAFKEGGNPFYKKSSAAQAYKISSQKNLFKRLVINADERLKIFNPG